jgi:periplasmic copper chaperone A
MTPRRTGRVLLALAAGTAGALVLANGAWAHAIVSPPVAKANELQQFTLSVPTEKENATTTKVELVVPTGFAIDSFEPAPTGWTQQVQSTGSGENAVVQRVTWTGGSVPTGQDAVFRFNASASGSKTYTFDVRQTYSDGSLVDWNGPESSDNPAPKVEAIGSFGGGSSTLAIVALAVGAVGVLVGLIALVGGRRPLT